MYHPLHRRLFPVLLLFTSPLLLSCGQQANTYTPPPPPTVTVEQPVQKEVTDYLEFTGTTAGYETGEVRARVKGFIEKIDFKPGSAVQAGQVLFTIDPRTFQATVNQAIAQLEAKKTQLNFTQANLAKNQELAKKNFVSDIELKLRTSERDIAKADVDLAEANLKSAQLDLSFTQVTAPISGIISRNHVDQGALVGAGDPTLLATIVNTQQIYANFAMSEQDLLSLLRSLRQDGNNPRQNGKKIPVFLALADETGFPHEGTFDYAENQVDPQTGTLRMRAVFDNSKNDIPAGVFVRLRVPISKQSALLVPDVAVAADQAGRYVLVVNNQNIVERRNVQVGPVSDRLRRIESGLQPDERVIVNGLLRARLGRPVQPETAATPPATDAKPPTT